MNRWIVLALTFLILALNYTHSNAQYNLSELVLPNKMGLSSDSLDKMNAHFHTLVDENRLAGIQTGIIKNGKLVHFDTYGFGNIEENELLNENSIFRIFSMTKPIVSIALMQLYEKGKFELDDPLYKYLPEFKSSFVLEDSILIAVKQPIRIIDLLRHTSGYNYGRSQNSKLEEYYVKADLRSSTTNAEFVNKLSTIPLQFEPGTDWQYGLSTNICGYLIEVLSGQSLNKYLHDSIFIPLHMNDTHFQIPVDKKNRFTVGYGWNHDNGLYISESAQENRYVNEVTLFNGGGGLVSTTFDYLLFCQMILNKGKLNGHHILNEETIDLMLSDHLKETRQFQEERLRLPYGEASFGLGFAIVGENPDTQQKIFGWGGAVGTYFKIDLENNLAYVMMIQLSPYRHLELRSRFQAFVNASIK